MAIGVEGDRYGRVTQELLHDLRMHMLRQKMGGCRMAEVVDAEARQAGTLESSVEGKGKVGHVSRPAIRAGEDKVVLVPQLRRLLPLSIDIPTVGFGAFVGFVRKG